MKPILAALLFLAFVSLAHAEHGGPAGFEKTTVHWYGISQTHVPNKNLNIIWSDDDSAAYFTLETTEGKVSKKVSTATGEMTPIDKIPTGKKRSAPSSPQSQPPRWESPDRKWKVEKRESALFLTEIATSKTREITKDNGPETFTGQPLWSPDSSRFMMWRTKDVPERQLHLVESSPTDQLQPKHTNRSYPKPGDEIDTRTPWIFFTDAREPIPADSKLIENPFECSNPAWRSDSKRFTFEFVERGFGKHHVIEINSETHVQRALVREDSDTFVFVSGNSFRRDLNDGEEILWMSERDGWKHLYLLDGHNGSVKRQLTIGDWIVRDVVEVDEKNREVLLKISGYFPARDPYLIHFVRANIDTGKLILLTQADGNHDRFERSPGGNYYVCSWSRIDHAPVTELHRWSDGRLVKTLVEADDTALRATGYSLPIPFAAKDRDGKYDIYGIVCLPPNFDSTKKYPVIEYIYAGPQDSYVPKSWKPWIQPMHEVAAHGFIVVQIDGKGTANRCADFHHFCYKNLKDAGFPDRIAWMKATAKKFPQMNLERVGIFGGSAGGQNALGALLFHRDFYKAAAADCGCHDNRMDKIWWNEQWMDWPVGPEYADNSNVTHAKNLTGALLLTVGELDENVDPSSTYQVINALIAADKDFEFIPMTGKGHGSGETRYGQRRRVDFFQRNLGGPK